MREELQQPFDEVFLLSTLRMVPRIFLLIITWTHQRTRRFMTMHLALHPRDDIEKLYVSRKGRRGLARSEDSVDTKTRRQYKKAQRKTNYNDQKHHRQHKHKQNKNNQKTKIRRKTTVRTFQATNKRNLTRKDLDMAKKEKSYERNGIFW